MPQLTKIIANVPGNGTNSPVAHSLGRTPTIHLLGVGTDPAVTRGNAPAGSSLFHSNSAGTPKPVVALAIAPHSIMLGGQETRIAAIQGTTSTGGIQTRPHGLIAIPDIIFVEFGTDALISTASITADGTNITFGQVGNGSGLVFGFLAVSLHSVWGVNQWKNIVTGNASPTGGNYAQIGAGLSNVAFPHGLQRAPGLILLGARTGAGVTVGSTSADATNIFLSSSAGVGRNVEALAIAGHSVIA